MLLKIISEPLKETVAIREPTARSLLDLSAVVREGERDDVRRHVTPKEVVGFHGKRVIGNPGKSLPASRGLCTFISGCKIRNSFNKDISNNRDNNSNDNDDNNNCWLREYHSLHFRYYLSCILNITKDISGNKDHYYYYVLTLRSKKCAKPSMLIDFRLIFRCRVFRDIQR